MVTDRRPSRGKLRQEYDESSRLIEIHVPRSDGLTPLFTRLQSARDEEARAPLSQACEELLRGFAEFYQVPPPELKLLGVRPHRTREGLLSYELLGDYNLTLTRVRLWTRTPMIRKWTSSRTLLSTLCHEFMHHLDVVQLGFGKSYHTTGFFERTHRLYLGVTGQPHYPLAWQAPQRNGSRSIDWPETNRRRASRANNPS
jgi:YD repeat-containing protein